MLELQKYQYISIILSQSVYIYYSFMWLHSTEHKNPRDFQFRGIPKKLFTTTQKQKHVIHGCFRSLFWVVIAFTMFTLRVFFVNVLSNIVMFQ